MWPQQLDPEQSLFIYFSHIQLQDQFNHNKNFSIYHVEILFATYIQVQSFLTSRLSGAAGELQGIKTDTEEQLFCTSHLFSIGLIHCSSQQYKILLFWDHLILEEKARKNFRELQSRKHWLYPPKCRALSVLLCSSNGQKGVICIQHKSH